MWLIQRKKKQNRRSDEGIRLKNLIIQSTHLNMLKIYLQFVFRFEGVTTGINVEPARAEHVYHSCIKPIGRRLGL